MKSARRQTPQQNDGYPLLTLFLLNQFSQIASRLTKDWDTRRTCSNEQLIKVLFGTELTFEYIRGISP